MEWNESPFFNSTFGEARTERVEEERHEAMKRTSEREGMTFKLSFDRINKVQKLKSV